MHQFHRLSSVRSIVCVASVLCSACGAPTEPAFVTLPGNITPIGSAVRVIVAPDTVRAGEVFTATINTFGSSCLVPSATTANVGGTVADLTVWDRRPTNTICPDDYRPIPRTVSLRFTGAGVATIRVSSRGKAPATGQDSITVVEKALVVR